MTCMRLPLPLAYTDPAFMKCLDEASDTPELIEQFDRLYKCSLSGPRSAIERMVDKACGKDEDDMMKFVEFVHDCIYLRLPDEAIHSLRAKALTTAA